MATLMQQRRGTAAEWATANPILAEGEIGVELDTGVVKVGNGSDNWKTLKTPYLLNAGGTVTALTATATPLTVKAANNQTADLMRWVNVDGSILARITAKGIFVETNSDNVTTKGDLLVGMGPDARRRLSVGAAGFVLTADPTSPTGLSWKPGSKIDDVQIFTASGTWTKPLNAQSVTVIAFGGGGSGAASNSSNEYAVAGGGPGGTREEHTFMASYLSATVAVTVGQGGANPATTVGYSNALGGRSQFGSYLTAEAGSMYTYNQYQGLIKPTAGRSTQPAGYGTVPPLEPLDPGAGGITGGVYTTFTQQQKNGSSPMGTVGMSRSGSGIGGDGGVAGYGGGQDGGIPGGGGGGSLRTDNESHRAGAGGRGEVIVITHF